jgi:phosphopantetheine adenylyltransferase
VLDIALPCPHLYGRLNAPRGPLYTVTQALVANIYKLICVIAANESIGTQHVGGVDARVVLVAYPRHGGLVHTPKDTDADQEARGPAIDLYTLARCPRPWHVVFSVEGEQGEAFLNHFLAMSAKVRPVSRLQGGIVHLTAPDASPTDESPPMLHTDVAVGGTFDHLHIGHKLLLTMFAFVLARQPPPGDSQARCSLTVGITGDQLLVNKKYADVLESWDCRQQAVHDFLSSVMHFGQPDDGRIRTDRMSEPGPNGHAVHVTYPSKLVIKYVQIMDPFGPTITDESISALVISKETRSGGAAVNTKREEKGWTPLEVFEIDVLDAGEEDVEDETFQSKLSSTEIRRLLSERANRTVPA